MEYVGHGSPEDEVVVRGDVVAREFLAFWLRDGLVTAAMNVNVWDVVEDLKALVAARSPLDPALLANPEVPLTEVLAAAQPSGTR
jgi:3-phenylpropionate/trans-cinnamate dioxygenase ferredoxin reductase subunit